MNTFPLFLLILCCSIPMTIAAQNGSKEILYVGTFSLRDSKGIYQVEFDRSTGKLITGPTYFDKESPSFLAVHPSGNYLYTVCREGLEKDDLNGSVISYKIDPSTGDLTKINEQSSNGEDACHVSIDPAGRFVYVSNYGSGNFAVYPIEDNGGLKPAIQIIADKGSGPNTNRQLAPHVHSIIPSPDGKFIYVSDLGTDEINVFSPGKAPDFTFRKVFTSNSTPGSGPRHFAIHPNGQFGYSVEELSSTVSAYRINRSSGKLIPLQRESTLPEGVESPENSGADIEISPDGKFLYASNRGHQSLVVFSIDQKSGKLTYIENVNTEGKHPRNFRIGQKGNFIFVVNRDTDNLVVFSRDPATGRMTYTGEQVHIPAAVCVQHFILPE